MHAGQIRNGSLQTLWAPKKNVSKNEEQEKKLLLSQISQVNNELPCVLFFKVTSYIAQKKWLKL